MLFAFFFQAEDGIRGRTVTGVQTCALPICDLLAHRRRADNLQDLKTGQLVGASPMRQQIALIVGVGAGASVIPWVLRSEERRVGKERTDRAAAEYDIERM